jgi:DNA/RNA endonuclease G (NUC1)
MKPLHGLLAAVLLCLAAGCASITSQPDAEQSQTGTVPDQPIERSASGMPLTNSVATRERYAIGGFPVTSSPVVLLVNTGYAVGFSEELEDPVWASYYCGPYAPFENGERPTKFSTDERVAPAARLKHTDYNRPPGKPTYDRGHMAPNYAIATR